jgi:GR25 family glycosyltransferase involved in LPS biosynthesis
VINMPSRTDRRDAVDLAASTTGIQFDFIDGVAGDSIPEFAFPPGGSSESIKLSKGIKGSWRSHMNVLNK